MRDEFSEYVTAEDQGRVRLITNIARIAKATLHKLPGHSSLNVRSVCPVCPSFPGFPVCPDDHDDHNEHDYNDNHNHDNHDDQFCTFTFWQQRQQIEFCQMFWSLIEIFLLMIDIFLLENNLMKIIRNKSIKQQTTY